jgi:hypothetical protein
MRGTSLAGRPDEARAQVSTHQHVIASAQDALAATASAARYAHETQTRLVMLTKAQDVSQADLDQANDVLRRADAARDAAQEKIGRNGRGSDGRHSRTMTQQTGNSLLNARCIGFSAACSGVAGLACPILSIESFPPWLLMLTTGIWIAAHVRGSQRGIGCRHPGRRGVHLNADPGLGTAGQHFSRNRSFCRHYGRAAGPAGGVVADSAIDDLGTGADRSRTGAIWLIQIAGRPTNTHPAIFRVLEQSSDWRITALGLSLGESIFGDRRNLPACFALCPCLLSWRALRFG